MRTFDLKPGRPRRSSPPSPGERLSLHLELHGRRITYRSGDRVGQRFLRAVCGKGRAEEAEDAEGLRACEASASSSSDRKSVVSGKSVSVSLDLGGRRISTTKKHTTTNQAQQ